MYQQYLRDPSSVDRAWQDLFADYKPGGSAAPASAAVEGNAVTPAVTAPVPAPAAAPAPAAPAPAPAAPAPKAAPAPAPKAQAAEASGDELIALRGPAKAVASNMDASLEVPTATSVRAVPAKLLIDNRIVINNHLQRARGGKVSFTHLIGYALVRAVKANPGMNHSYRVEDGKSYLVKPEHVNLGLAIDLV
ncbi:2-oxo acid dehydrogenase subunit E2, partial [Kitasatospora phosalacinea]